MSERRKYSTVVWISSLILTVAVLVALGFAVGLTPVAPKEDRIKLEKWLKAATIEASADFKPAKEISVDTSLGKYPSAFTGVFANYNDVGTLSLTLPPEIIKNSAENNADVIVNLFPTLIPGSDIAWAESDGAAVPLPMSKNVEKACFTSNGVTVAAAQIASIGKSEIQIPVEIIPEFGLLTKKYDRQDDDGMEKPSVICIRYEVIAGTSVARGVLPVFFHPELSLSDRAILMYRLSVVRPFYANFVNKGRWHYLTSGLCITLEVALCAVILGIILGFIVAVIRSTHDKEGGLDVLNAVSKAYLTVIRGTPMTVQLLIAYYVIFASSNNGVLVAILAFGFNSGAYVAEIMRAGITSIDDGQMEAGRSLGLSYVQTLFYIILPQAIRNVLPALGNEFIVLLKDTSIASFIALRDLSKGGEIIRSQTYDAFMPFLMVAAIYLVLVMFFTWLLGKLERRLHKTTAR